jgi:hypothetical protein
MAGATAVIRVYRSAKGIPVGRMMLEWALPHIKR